MSPIETLRGFVNAWACDENDHLNVQFYFAYFEDAAGHFFALTDVAPQDRPRVETRHVRFHSELRGGQLVRIRSHAARAEAAQRWHLVHRMSEPATDRLVATALDTYAGVAPVPSVAQIIDEARPRSLAPEPPEIAPLSGRNPPVTHRGRLSSHEIDTDGSAYHAALVARFSDAAPHFWEAVGASQPWLAENRLGRVALEMKVTQVAPAKPGLIELRSGPLATSGKTVSFFHLVTQTDTGTLIAGGEVTALLFDQRERRAIRLPEQVRQAVEGALAEAEAS